MKNVFRGILLVGLVFSSLVLLAGTVIADDDAPASKLKGTYARSVYRSCLFTTDGNITLNNDGELIVGGDASTGNPQARFTAIRGRVTFNGDGTGSLESELGRMRLTSHVVVEPGPGNTRSSRIPSRALDRRESSCTFDYTVFPDNSFVMDNISCASESIPVGRNGNPASVTGIVLQGQMGHGAQTLLINDNDTNVEEIVSTDPNGVETKFERICVRSGTAVKVSGKNKKDDD